MKKTTLFTLSLLLSTVAYAGPPYAEEPKEKIPSQIPGSKTSLPVSLDQYSTIQKSSNTALNSSIDSCFYWPARLSTDIPQLVTDIQHFLIDTGMTFSRNVDL